MTTSPDVVAITLAAAILAGSCWLTFSLLLALLYRGVRGHIATLPTTMRRTLLLWYGATPLAASIVVTLCVMVPDGVLLHTHCHAAFGCETHTPRLGTAGIYLWLPALLASTTTLHLLLRVSAAWHTGRRAAGQLRQLAAGRDQRGFRLLATDRPLALCAGWWRGEVLLSSGLVVAMNADELEVIIAHERAHACQRDNLLRLALALLFCPVAAKPAAPLLHDFALAAEQLADRAAARRTSVERVARTLLRAQRLGLRTPHPGYSAFTPSALELRLHALYASPAIEPSAWMIPMAQLLLSLAAVACGIDAGHHAIESLFGAAY